MHENMKEQPQFKDRVLGCWLGKAIGGTLGMPFEGAQGPHNIDFYTPVPTEMIPNDDLDLQVVWACHLMSMEIPVVDRNILAEAWLKHVGFQVSEYGIAIRNLKMGIKPPYCGSYDNWFKDGMGAAIRSEIWACLAPCDPKLAAAYAYEDACVDHSDEGILAEVFLAAVESCAFGENNLDLIIDMGLSVLPESSLIKHAVEDTQKWWAQEQDWLKVRANILQRYDHEDFTNVTMNIAFMVLALLAGEGDFSNSICIANNCGKDTDCTAATVGSILGIMNPFLIPQKWLAPIGSDLVLSPAITGLKAPDTLQDFTEMILTLRNKINGKWPEPIISEDNTHEYTLKVEMANVSWSYVALPNSPAPKMPEWSKTVRLPGTFATLPLDQFEKEVMLISYCIHIPKVDTYRVMLSSREIYRVWIDDDWAFASRAGNMYPSFHYHTVIPNSDKEVELSAGKHNVTVAIHRPKSDKAEWVFGITKKDELGEYPWLFDLIFNQYSLK